MNVLVVGAGGREHALSWKLSQSKSVSKVICPNGNPGISLVAETPRIQIKHPSDWLEIAKNHQVDLVVIGPEAPLAEGLGDYFVDRGYPVFGPGKEGAQIESSKTWSKKVMRDAGVPTAAFDTFSDPVKAKDFAKTLGLPVVIKADGLAAGKGVTVATTWEEVEQAINENLVGKRFGDSSSSVLIEEFMEGVEASVFGLCDGETVFPLVAAQDHKRIFNNDEGPNTGGMGAYAPTPFVTEEIFTATYGEILKPTLHHMKNLGIDYKGVLYAGLMLTKEGPKVVEFNCRFGDPETQVVLPLLDGDFGEILMACATGKLHPLTMGATKEQAGAAPTAIGTKPLHAMTVVLSSEGYPGSYPKGLPISGLDQWKDDESGIVFHAGTAFDDAGNVVTSGGRVLACTAWDTTLAGAKKKSYEMADSIKFKGAHFRQDIGAKAFQ